MRIANVDGRLALLSETGALDVAEASGGRFSSDPQTVFERWDEFSAWARSAPPGTRQVEPGSLGAPSPRPRQIFAIGMNYLDHIEEIGASAPDTPSVFTKFLSSVACPQAVVSLPAGGSTDWEAELVAVISRPAYRVAEESAWDHVAGLTVGQDISERQLQTAGSPPQFSLGKSYGGFAPMGPWLVTPDELADADDLAIRCTLNGETVQSSRTSQLVFPVADLVARLSAVVTLMPGDVIFTGTPGGVGAGRTPPRFLQPGDVLVSEIEGIGSIEQRFVAEGAR